MVTPDPLAARAAEAGNFSAVTIILKAGAKIDARSITGETPLAKAAAGSGASQPKARQRAEVIRFLAKHGADVNAADQQGRRPIDNARKQNEDEIGLVRMPTIDEDADSSDNQGQMVAMMADDWGYTFNSIDPEDAGAVGMAVTNVDDSHGTWQYSADGGTTWNDITGVGDDGSGGQNALLLDPEYWVRFVPNAGFFGTVPEGIDFYAWNEETVDSSGDFQPAAGQLADVDEDPVASGISSDESFATIYVQPNVTLASAGDGQFTVSTDGPVPNDLLVTISTSGAVTSPPPSGYAPLYYYLTSSAQNWSGLNGTEITVDIPAGSQSATIDVNAALYCPAATITAYLSGADAELAGFASSDSYNIGTTAGVTTSLAASSTTDTDPNNGAYWSGWGCSWNYDDITTSQDYSGVSAIVLSALANTAQGTGTATWHTVSGTAASGTDYSDNSGTFSWSEGDDTQQTASIQISHNASAGEKMFYIVWHGQWTDAIGNTYNYTWIQPVYFANPTLRIYGDTNGDDQLSVDDDPPSGTSAGSINVPIIDTDPSDAAGAVAGSGTMASDGLVPIHIDAYAGSNATLTLTATGSGTVQAWLDPQETQPIDLTDGATFDKAHIPETIWVLGKDAGDIELGAQLAYSPAAAQALTALMALNAVPAGMTTVAVGHSAWAYNTAAAAGVPSNSPLAKAVIVAGIGCSTPGAAVQPGVSPMQRLQSVNNLTAPPTPSFAVPSGLPLLPRLVWAPKKGQPTATIQQLRSDQILAESQPPVLRGYAIPRPPGVQSGDGPGQWPGIPSNLKAFLNTEVVKYKIMMRAFVNAVITDALRRMFAESASAWTINFTFDPGAADVVTRDQFRDDVFGKGVQIGSPLNIGSGRDVTFAQPSATTLQLTITAYALTQDITGPFPRLPWIGVP